MKSDREFLDGIYQKAALEIEQPKTNNEKNEKQHTFFRRFFIDQPLYPRLLTSCCLVLCLALILFLRNFGPEETTVTPIGRNADITPAGGSNANTDEDIAGDFVVCADVVTATENAGTWTVEISLTSCLRGDVGDIGERMTFTCEALSGMYFDAGNVILCALTRTTDTGNGYALYGGLSGWCNYVDTDERGAYYLSGDGRFIHACDIE